MGTFFTDRLGGASSGEYASLNLGDHVGDDLEVVVGNRALVSAKFGSTQYMSQVHGNRVAIIEEVTDEVPTADALVTGIPGITLAANRGPDNRRYLRIRNFTHHINGFLGYSVEQTFTTNMNRRYCVL